MQTVMNYSFRCYTENSSIHSKREVEGLTQNEVLALVLYFQSSEIQVYWEYR
jgi:hypothetical protein